MSHINQYISAKVSSIKVLKVLLTKAWTENTLNSRSLLCLNYLTIVSLTVSVVAGIRPVWFEPNSQFSTFHLLDTSCMQSFFQYLLKNDQ